jgi:phospho-N-acetylmuramoyl-pentapeptide-transferase
MDFTIIKLLVAASLAFWSGIFLTPFLTHFLYKYKVWKKTGGKTTLHGAVATEFNRLKGQNEVKTPRMGGIVIWGSVVMTIFILWVWSFIWPERTVGTLQFISREQTWIPLTALLVGAIIGFINDFYDVTHEGKGLQLKIRLIIITALASFIGWWFYSKIGISTIAIPFMSEPLFLGVGIIIFFVLLSLMLYASGVIDGIDGLSGGVFASVFLAYSMIAYMQSQYDIAAFCAAVTGGILAFLWFNIPPARFWMTETGSMSLTLALAVVVFMTDTLGGGHGISLFLIIGLPLIATVSSVVLQVVYRKIYKKKLFRIAPLHHHFEAIGWPSEKVTMRYWIISIVCAFLGITLSIVL